MRNLSQNSNFAAYNLLNEHKINLTNRKSCFMESLTNETGISDHHKLIYTFLKSTYAKGKPKFVYYICFKNFNKELIKKNLSENIKNIGNSLEVFYDTSIITDF